MRRLVAALFLVGCWEPVAPQCVWYPADTTRVSTEHMTVRVDSIRVCTSTKSNE